MQPSHTTAAGASIWFNVEAILCLNSNWKLAVYQLIISLSYVLCKVYKDQLVPTDQS